jgi:hypothetical protein
VLIFIGLVVLLLVGDSVGWWPLLFGCAIIGALLRSRRSDDTKSDDTKEIILGHSGDVTSGYTVNELDRELYQKHLNQKPSYNPEALNSIQGQYNVAVRDYAVTEF